MAVTTSIPHCTYCNKPRKERQRDIKIKKKQVKLSYFTDDIIVCTYKTPGIHTYIIIITTNKRL